VILIAAPVAAVIGFSARGVRAGVSQCGALVLGGVLGAALELIVQPHAGHDEGGGPDSGPLWLAVWEMFVATYLAGSFGIGWIFRWWWTQVGPKRS